MLPLLKMYKLQKVEQFLLFLTILFLPTQLGKHFWPQFSFVYSLPIDYFSPVFYFWDLLVVLLLSIFLMQKKSVNRVALNLFLLFILTQVLSLIFAANIGAGLVRLEQYLVAGLFGIYIASSKMHTQQLVFWGLVLSMATGIILAILQFIFGGTLGLWILGERSFTLSTPGIAKFDFYGIQFLRPYATFPHPNVLAGFLVVTVIFLQMKNPDYQRFIRKVISFFAGVVILLTVSRVVIAAGFVWAMISLKNKHRFLLVAGFVILLPILYTRFSSVLTFDNLALTRREELSGIALTLFFKSPVLGVGLNNFISAGADFLLVGPSRFLQPVHNIFLLSMSETGIVGLFGWLMLVGFPIWKRSYLFVWVMIIVLGLFDHYFLTLPQGYRLLFLVWGMSLIPIKSGLTAPAKIS